MSRKRRAGKGRGDKGRADQGGRADRERRTEVERRPETHRRDEAERQPSKLGLLFAPLDAASISVFRIGFGLLLAWQAVEFLAGRLERLYLDPAFHFPYPGFEWLPMGPPWALWGILWTLFFAGLLIAAGLLTRICSLLWAVGYAYVNLLDTAAYNNHEYLICLLAGVMAVIPAERAASVAALLRTARRPATVPAWSLWLLRLQLGLPYFFGGIAKINGDWLLRAQPMRLWFADGTEGKATIELTKASWMPWALSWGGMLLDLLALPLLLWPRTRPWAMGLLVLFHVANSQLFYIGIFPWLMIWATLVFLPPDWPRRARLMRPAGAGERAAAAVTPRWRVVATTAALAVWLLVQLALPLRHFLVPGNVDWTEEGHRFAWRMKLRDKRGGLSFVAVDPATGQRIPLDQPVATLLTRRQRIAMMHDPEMIRQLAVHIHRQLREGGLGHYQVRVESQVSLNGRPAQPFVRPEVDLAAVARDAPAEAWIEPLRPLGEQRAQR